MKDFMKILLTLSLLISLGACSSFKAKRVDADTSDDEASEITDEWVNRDTEIVIKDVIARMEKHRGFKNYIRKTGKVPAVFIAEVQNDTTEAYFPIADLNDELLNELSGSGDFRLVDNRSREALLKEITYQHGGMVDPKTVKQIGRQTGADLLIFGAVRMRPKSRSGKTIKEYSVNIYMTDLETGVEVVRTRAKLQKFSEKSKFGF